MTAFVAFGCLSIGAVIGFIVCAVLSADKEK